MINQQTILAPFRLYISYSQITVCHAGLEAPFNNWTQAHVDQGFAWRPESVSFKTLTEAGIAEISVAMKDQIDFRANAIRVIQVPFAVPMDGKLEIASITENKEIEIKTGEYALFFETGLLSNETTWCHFTFRKTKLHLFKIVLADHDLTFNRELKLTADPA